MRIYSTAREMMSEMGRDLWEMGIEVIPKTYQNKNIEGNKDFITKEEFCKQYCLTSLPDPEYLFVYNKSKDWAEAELKERLSGKRINPGEAYHLREELWAQFLDSDNKFDYTYPERLNHYIKYKDDTMTIIQGIISLLKDDPDTRKATLLIFTEVDSNYYDGSKRIPCSMYYGFFIRGGKLNITYHQRSSDFVQHFGNDVYLAYRLMEYIAKEVGTKPGMLIHTIDSLHVYQKDWHLIKSSIDDLIK